jgi:hypothetical protein
LTKGGGFVGKNAKLIIEETGVLSAEGYLKGFNDVTIYVGADSAKVQLKASYCTSATSYDRYFTVVLGEGVTVDQIDQIVDVTKLSTISGSYDDFFRGPSKTATCSIKDSNGTVLGGYSLLVGKTNDVYVYNNNEIGNVVVADGMTEGFTITDATEKLGEAGGVILWENAVKNESSETEFVIGENITLMTVDTPNDTRIQKGTVTVNGGDVTITASTSDKAALTNAAIKLPATGEYIAKLGTKRDGSGATDVTGTAAANDKQYCYFRFANVVNEFTKAPAIEGWTAGETPKAPTAEAKYGDVFFFYAAPNGTFSTTVPTEAGVYFMIAVAAEGTKEIEGTELAYAQLISNPVRFVIKAAAGSTEPEGTTPSTPGATTPEATTPGATTPGATTPEATTPATPVPPTGDTFNPMVIVLVLASVAALAVLALNRKKFI